MAASPPFPCGVREELLAAFFEAVSEYHRLQSAQMDALLKGEDFPFEEEIARVAEQRTRAKYAILAHRAEHGC